MRLGLHDAWEPWEDQWDAPKGLCLLTLSDFCGDSDTHLERWHLIFKLLTELRSQGETQPYAEKQISLLVHILPSATTEEDEDRIRPLWKSSVTGSLYSIWLVNG